jgi:hypothetical protein
MLLGLIEGLDWTPLRRDGFAPQPPLLTKDECDELKSLYTDDALFRSTIDMERFNFGKGQYRYFKYPLPPLVQELRERLYAQLAPVANDWSARLKLGLDFPAQLGSFLERLRERGQTKPTPLLLRYRTGDYNCLHQDVSKDLCFPYQVVFGLSEAGIDYEGGQLILTQQRPRMQTVPHVLTLPLGGAVAFTSNLHPQQGRRGFFRTVFRHGVSRIERGDRYTLGIVFHDFR